MSFENALERLEQLGFPTVADCLEIGDDAGAVRLLNESARSMCDDDDDRQAFREALYIVATIDETV